MEVTRKFLMLLDPECHSLAWYPNSVEDEADTWSSSSLPVGLSLSS